MTQKISALGVLTVLAGIAAGVPAPVRAGDIEGVCVRYCDDSDSDGDRDYGYRGNGNDLPSRIGTQINHFLTGLLAAPGNALKAAQQAAQQAERDRRARAHDLNEAGVEADDAGDYDAAIRYYTEARSYAPDDQVIRNNLAGVRAAQANQLGIRAMDAGDWAAAVRYFETAHGYDPRSAAIADNLTDAREAVAEAARREHELRVAAAERERQLKIEQERADADRRTLALALNADTRTRPQSDSGDIVVPSPGTPVFGRDANPAGQTFVGVPADRGVVNDTRFGGLSSAAKDSHAAATASSPEQAKHLGGCGTADLPCTKGDAPPAVQVNGVPRGSAILKDWQLTDMLTSPTGSRLIGAEAAARRSEAAARGKLAAIDMALDTARDADKPALAVTRADLYQTWSNERAKLDAAQLAVEDEARKHYHFDATEQPNAKSASR